MVNIRFMRAATNRGLVASANSFDSSCMPSIEPPRVRVSFAGQAASCWNIHFDQRETHG